MIADPPPPRAPALWDGKAGQPEQRYARGGTSEADSYRAPAEVKAAFLNDFVHTRGVGSVIEFGCGDGNQLSLADYPRYIGLDVSRSAIALCQRPFADDPAKSFFLYDDACFIGHDGLFTADPAISLDVIYHLAEDPVFETYMAHLFAVGVNCVIVYATNGEMRSTAPHVRHRHFTAWVAAHCPGWRLLQVTQGQDAVPIALITLLTSVSTHWMTRGEAQGGGVLLRSALERMTHRIIVRRRLPSPFAAARIYVSSEGGLRFLGRGMAQVDPALLRLAAETVRRGDTVWDIGANVGLFSFAAAVAAGPSGRVLAVEPDTVLAGLLRRSVAVNNGQAPVDVLSAAVSGEESLARFHVAKRNRATNHLDGYGTSQTGGVRSTQLVPALTLDWLAARFPRPNMIKIDVEQAEVAVLTGGSRVLGLARTVICEVAASNSAVVRDLLTRHGYTLYNGDLPASERVPVANAPANTLAVRISASTADSGDLDVVVSGGVRVATVQTASAPSPQAGTRDG